MKTTPFLTAGTVICLALLLAGCGQKKEANAATQLPVASVKVAAVEKKSRPATEDVMGTVRAKLRASIEAKVSGKIERMLVAPGQAVKAGELLETPALKLLDATLLDVKAPTPPLASLSVCVWATPELA